ncbi:MAG: hypothetical protein AOA65_0288 [Candidatus Bathyarchaeota archaeon BA1]|nr:MAG: hypothetical protein AOA65_0288 [Candidatus Bathyarchaeota archaeon BA1]
MIPPYVFWVRKTPLIAPIKPAIAAETLLFHVPKQSNARFRGLRGVVLVNAVLMMPLFIKVKSCKRMERAYINASKFTLIRVYIRSVVYYTPFFALKARRNFDF